MLAVGAVLFGSNQITPQLMQTNFPYTAMLSGLAMMPGGLAMLLMMPIAGQIIPRMQPKYWMAIGFTIIALAMWYSTSLVPDASFGYFATVRVFQTIGMPFMFIPINSRRLCRAAAAKDRRRRRRWSMSRAISAAVSACRSPTSNWCSARNSISRGWSRT